MHKGRSFKGESYKTFFAFIEDLEVQNLLGYVLNSWSLTPTGSGVVFAVFEKEYALADLRMDHGVL